MWSAGHFHLRFSRAAPAWEADAALWVNYLLLCGRRGESERGRNADGRPDRLYWGQADCTNRCCETREKRPGIEREIAGAVGA